MLNIEGTVLVSGDEEYEKARQNNFAVNAAHLGNENDHDGALPALIVQVSSVEDVQKAVLYASEHKLSVCVRSGGHNWFGSFLRSNSLLLDMSSFDSIDISPHTQTATVGPCAKGQDLNDQAAKYGLCSSTGHCVGVPLGGFLLGGGFGWLFTHFGKAAEAMEVVTIVTADGSIVESTSQEKSETLDKWMWLARGSASAFPGVVVSIQLKLHPLPPILRSRTSFHPISDFEKIVAYLTRVVDDGLMSSKIEVNTLLSCTPPSLFGKEKIIKDPKICVISASGIAESEEEWTNIIGFLDHIPSVPYLPATFADYSSFSGLSNELGAVYPEGWSWACRSYEFDDTSKHEVDFCRIRSVFEQDAPIGLSHVLCVVCPTRPSVKKGAYGDSVLPLFIGTYGSYNNDDAEEKTAALHMQDGIANIVDPFVTKYNPLEHPLDKTTFHKSFGDPEKLLQLRNQCDPYGIFFDPSKANPRD
mmetsp:Transcript_25606/g.46376  ORF Transcript_25606/g.46376 Transcript_25606/m.46376 type:complete len:473 (-) Transcript_25606:256-1674(-)|eukprot:CAMPEP_0198304680 /NCGR_PEP_ID=MMETSP1449-20131203/57519_1 /TAXON_ID=420275 /ORGANISM="Attheya septentrionalis, Strain CCMP2084" /LENGTH=472 /DNA_ID=CAMNT_0044007209 /DNA_START=114 /DNA_END=1532 /DNA_ORIENTATION=-